MNSHPYVVGVDPATVTGICEGHVGSTPVLYTCRLHGTHEEKYGEAARFFTGILSPCKPDLIAIEAPIMATWGKTNARTTDFTRGLYAVFVGIAGSMDIPIRPVEVRTWRKYFLGTGKLPGPEAKRQCLKLCEQLKWATTDHNAAEAAGIWMWAGSQIDPRNVQRAEPLFIGAQA